MESSQGSPDQRRWFRSYQAIQNDNLWIKDENFKIEALETKKHLSTGSRIFGKNGSIDSSWESTLNKRRKMKNRGGKKSQKSIDKTMNSRPEIRSTQGLQNQDKRWESIDSRVKSMDLWGYSMNIGWGSIDIMQESMEEIRSVGYRQY